MLQLQEKDRAYLSGEAFSTVYPFVLQRNSAPDTRLNFLRRLLPGKSVIHFGCVDHLPVVEQRRREQRWVHEEMAKVCSAIVGIDIVQEGIDYMNRAGYEAYNSNVVTQEVPVAVSSRRWDYILAGEVLEHISDPVLFLSKIREKYAAFTERIIITVPNALAYTNFRWALRNTEFINTDHRYWFTGYTLSKVATDAGITVEGLEFCVDYLPSVFSVKYHLMKKNPVMRDRVILIGRL